MLIRATQVSDAVFFNFKDKFLKVAAIHFSPKKKKKQKSMKIFFETKKKKFKNGPSGARQVIQAMNEWVKISRGRGAFVGNRHLQV